MDDLNTGGYSFDTQSSFDAASFEDDEMAAFEAECARRLEAEHKRRAEEKAAQAKAAETEPEISEIFEPEKEEADASGIAETEGLGQKDDFQSEMKSDNPMSSSDQVSPEGGEYSAELSAIMQEESDRQKKHAAFAEAQEEAHSYDGEGSELPNSVRFMFTLILLVCGAVGVYIMAEVKYKSYFINPLCFVEVSVCLLGALGINTALISNRLIKSLLMKCAALALFLFYCLYAMQTLSLTEPLRDGFGSSNWLVMARDGISFNAVGDVAKMGGLGMAQCMVFVMPFAFFVLILVKPMRIPGIYFSGMAVLLFAAGALRVITETGYISLAQSVICLAGSAISYIIFMLPPMQSLVRSSGLIGWVKVRDED